MKIREGFISNSSSTSYVVILPNSFKLDRKVVQHYLKEHMKKNSRSNVTVESVIALYNEGLEDEDLNIWQEGNRAEFDILHAIFEKEKFIVGQGFVGSDAGKFILVTKDKYIMTQKIVDSWED